MPCYRPLRAWRSRLVNESGKRSLVFNRKDGYEDLELEVPCGQCIGCRLERSRQWAIRCVHEASLYEDNCFITLTYDDEHLPKDGSVHVDHFQKFMKRLRKKFPGTIRFFHCGEYGEENWRPHYHACLFNFDFPDKKLFKMSGEHRLYSSEALDSLWTFGFSLIGDVTFESAAYVARYITKKVTGDKADEHYNGRRPEYVTMSRRPGIGTRWVETWKHDIYPSGYTIINGKRVRLPKFYDSLLEESELTEIKNKRILNAVKHLEPDEFLRRWPKEVCAEARASLLKRSLENGS